MKTTEIKKLLDPGVRRLYEDLNKLMKSLSKRHSNKEVDVYEQYLAATIRYYSNLNLRRYVNIWGVKICIKMNLVSCWIEKSRHSERSWISSKELKEVEEQKLVLDIQSENIWLSDRIISSKTKFRWNKWHQKFK